MQNASGRTNCFLIRSDINIQFTFRILESDSSSDKQDGPLLLSFGFCLMLLFLRTINHFIIWICNQTSGRGYTKYAGSPTLNGDINLMNSVLANPAKNCWFGLSSWQTRKINVKKAVGLLRLCLSGNLRFCGLIDPTASCKGRDLRPYYDFKCNIYPLALQPNIKTAVKWLTP